MLYRCTNFKTLSFALTYLTHVHWRHPHVLGNNHNVMAHRSWRQTLIVRHPYVLRPRVNSYTRRHNTTKEGRKTMWCCVGIPRSRVPKFWRCCKKLYFRPEFPLMTTEAACKTFNLYFNKSIKPHGIMSMYKLDSLHIFENKSSLSSTYRPTKTEINGDSHKTVKPHLRVRIRVELTFWNVTYTLV